MTTPTDRAPSAPLPQPDPRTPVDREAIGRRLAAVVWHPNFDARDALDDWLTLIEGIAGYLRITADPSPNQISNPGVIGSEYSAMGDAIMKAAQIASILVDAVAEGAA